MQATYCDLCKKRIKERGVRKEMPKNITNGAHWVEMDLCPECVAKIADYCKKLRVEED